MAFPVFGSYKYDDDGYASYSSGLWDNITGKSNEAQRYVQEYNQQLKQYNQQYQLQKEAQEANIANLKFNQDMANRQQDFSENLANRQQDLSEKSYYEGIINEAKQLNSLGINPAAYGGVLSGSTMSGGSASGAGSVSGIGSAGSPNSVNPKQGVGSLNPDLLGLLSTILGYKTSKKSNDIAQQNADTAEYNANTQRMTAEADVAYKSKQGDYIDSNIKLNDAQKDYIYSNIAVNDSNIEKVKSEMQQISANIAYTNAQIGSIAISDAYTQSRTAHQLLESQDLKKAIDILGVYGLSPQYIKSLSNVSVQSLVAMGIVGIVGNAGSPDKYDDNITKEEERREELGLPTLTQEVAEIIVEKASNYMDMKPVQRDAVADFFEKHPNLDSSLVPPSTYSGWKADPQTYTYDKITSLLEKLYGV